MGFVAQMFERLCFFLQLIFDLLVFFVVFFLLLLKCYRACNGFAMNLKIIIISMILIHFASYLCVLAMILELRHCSPG